MKQCMRGELSTFLFGFIEHVRIPLTRKRIPQRWVIFIPIFLPNLFRNILLHKQCFFSARVRCVRPIIMTGVRVSVESLGAPTKKETYTPTLNFFRLWRAVYKEKTCSPERSEKLRVFCKSNIEKLEFLKGKSIFVKGKSVFQKTKVQKFLSLATLGKKILSSLRSLRVIIRCPDALGVSAKIR